MFQRSRRIPDVMLLAIMIGLAFQSNSLALQDSSAMLGAGDKAPNFELKSLNGDHDTELAGLNKAVVLFFGSYS